MDNSRLIYEYIDSHLDKENENELFKALYLNEDLRSEFRRAILVESSMQKDASTLYPSLRSIESTFARMGFATIGGATTEIQKTEIDNKKPSKGWFFKSGLLSNVTTALVSAGLTALIMYAIFNRVDDTLKQATMPGTANNNGQYVSSFSENGLKTDNLRSNNNIKTSKAYSEQGRGDTRVRIFSSGPPLADYVTVASNDTVNPVMNITENNLNGVSFYPVYYFLKADNQEYPHVSIQTEQKVPEVQKTGISLQLNNTVKAFYAPKAKIDESTASIPVNVSITALYSLSEKIAVGIDLRNEYIYQEYSGTENGVEYDYLQYPDLFSVALACRYRFYELNKFASFTELQAGVNSAGFIGRLSLGFSYAPDPAYMFIVGLEGSEFMYHHNSKSFFTSKLGIHYGVAVNF